MESERLREFREARLSGPIAYAVGQTKRGVESASEGRGARPGLSTLLRMAG
jgi:hypothetical protein